MIIYLLLILALVVILLILWMQHNSLKELKHQVEFLKHQVKFLKHPKINLPSKDQKQKTNKKIKWEY